MADNLAIFPGITPNNWDPDILLDQAKGELDEVVIIGTRKDGGEYFKSSVGGGPEVLWHLARAKLRLLRVADEE